MFEVRTTGDKTWGGGSGSSSFQSIFAGGSFINLTNSTFVLNKGGDAIFTNNSQIYQDESVQIRNTFVANNVLKRGEPPVHLAGILGGISSIQLHYISSIQLHYISSIQLHYTQIIHFRAGLLNHHFLNHHFISPIDSTD